MIDALPTLKERLKKSDPTVLFSVVNDLSKVTFFLLFIGRKIFKGIFAYTCNSLLLSQVFSS